MPNPGGYALVLDPTIIMPGRTCKFSRVLVDGDSSINILYRDTMTKLGLEAKDLELTQTIFHGIIPGLSCSPLVGSGLTSCSATAATSDVNRSCSRWWTCPAHMTHCWADPRSPNSWRSPTTRI